MNLQPRRRDVVAFNVREVLAVGDRRKTPFMTPANGVTSPGLRFMTSSRNRTTAQTTRKLVSMQTDFPSFVKESGLRMRMLSCLRYSCHGAMAAFFLTYGSVNVVQRCITGAVGDSSISSFASLLATNGASQMKSSLLFSMTIGSVLITHSALRDVQTDHHGRHVPDVFVLELRAPATRVAL